MLSGMKKYLKIFKLTVLIVLLNVLCFPFASKAQGPTLPDCGSNTTDPGNPFGNGGTCPLDTWVWVLVLCVVGFSLFNIYRKKQQALTTV